MVNKADPSPASSSTSLADPSRPPAWRQRRRIVRGAHGGDFTERLAATFRRSGEGTSSGRTRNLGPRASWRRPQTVVNVRILAALGGRCDRVQVFEVRSGERQRSQEA